MTEIATFLQKKREAVTFGTKILHCLCFLFFVFYYPDDCRKWLSTTGRLNDRSCSWPRQISVVSRRIRTAENDLHTMFDS